MRKCIYTILAVVAFFTTAYALKETLGGKVIQDIDVLSPYKYKLNGVDLIAYTTGTYTAPIYVIVNATNTAVWNYLYKITADTTTLLNLYTANASTDTAQWSNLYKLTLDTTTLLDLYTINASTDLAQWDYLYELTLDTATLKELYDVNASTDTDQWNYLYKITDSTGDLHNAVADIAQGTHTPAYFDISLTSRPAACLHWDLDQSSVTTINVGGQYELIAGTTALRTSSWFAKQGEAGVKYLYDNPHRFLVNVAGCMADVTQPAGTACLQVFHNGNATGYKSKKYFSTQDKLENTSIACVLNLVEDDYIDLRITTLNGDNISVCSMTLVLTPIN